MAEENFCFNEKKFFHAIGRLLDFIKGGTTTEIFFREKIFYCKSCEAELAQLSRQLWSR